jgi:uncharacterized protein (TIGR03790 family)
MLALVLAGTGIHGIELQLRAAGGSGGEQVAIVFNSRMPESRMVAEHYAEKRGIPTDQIIGLDMPVGETVTRDEYRESIHEPILHELDRRGLFSIASEIQPATSTKAGEVRRRIEGASVRYLVLCYGVPVRILRDSRLKEEGQEKVRSELQRNEAAVDNELALLPRLENKPPLFGPLRNSHYGSTNAPAFHPTNGILMVARLDGPTPAIAQALVDKAVQAEADGLWGRAYIDARGITNGDYRLGDEWMRNAAEICRRTGFETVLDNRPETFAAGFPMSHVAIYVGWYDGHVSGPFLQPRVEFAPGAFAYHLHSFSANHLRNPHQNWVGPLLARGATISMGSVDEPYLEGTPDVASFLGRLVGLGFTFGEAAYASIGSLSWQTTVVGDPLYRPFGRHPAEQHAELVARQNPLVEWSVLKWANMRLAQGEPPSKWIETLEQEPTTKRSPVLQEKLGDLCQAAGRIGDCLEHYEAVLRLNPSPQQRVRVQLNLPRLLANFRREKEAIRMLETFLTEQPDYPDRAGVYQRLLSIATDAADTTLMERCRREIEKLTPKPAAAKP